MNRDINIFVSCHKPCYIPRHELLFPIQVGTATSSLFFSDMLHDNDGENNISHKNSMYCELTAQYWVWKNVKCDYYGFFHYRRYMSFANEKFTTNAFGDVLVDDLSKESIIKLKYDSDYMRKIINSYDIITTTAVKLKDLNYAFSNNYEQYIAKSYEYKEDIELLLEIIKEKYPDSYDCAYRYMYEIDYGYFCNMFIMKDELFREYSEWLFTILEEHEKRRDYTNYNVDAYRVSGYLGERLFGIYYLYKKAQGVSTCELQRTLFLDVGKKEVLPICKERNVPIVIATNERYASYSSVLLASVLEQGTPENYYDILLLSHDMEKKSREKLEKMVSEVDNASIRIIDPHYLVKEYKLVTKAHFSVETYYRLVLPQLLPEYDKVLYLDVDMVVKSDVANLYNTDLEGDLIGAVYDIDTAGLYNGFQPDKKKYMDSELQLKNPYNYFQAGVLLINLSEFRKSFSIKEVLDMVVSKQWQLLDQDVLNKLCEGRVRFVDMSWNVLYDYGDIRVKKIFRLAPQWQYEMYIKARKEPKIIHFAGPEKPWEYPDCDFAEEFWKYARKSPFYEIILYSMLKNVNRKRVTSDRMFEKKSNSPVYKAIRCWKLYGFQQMIRECKREVSKVLK